MQALVNPEEEDSLCYNQHECECQDEVRVSVRVKDIPNQRPILLKVNRVKMTLPEVTLQIRVRLQIPEYLHIVEVSLLTGEVIEDVSFLENFDRL